MKKKKTIHMNITENKYICSFSYKRGKIDIIVAIVDCFSIIILKYGLVIFYLGFESGSGLTNSS